MESGRIERNPLAPEPAPAPRAGQELEREAAERLDEIRQYFKDRYARRDVVARTTTATGEELDWVPAGSHAEPPDLEGPQPPGDPGRPRSPQTFEQAGHQAETGPPGTVPVVRRPLDDITATGTLEDYLAKGTRAKRFTPPDDIGPETRAAAAVHKYAHAAQWVANFGTEGFINTWRPYVQWSNEFSLGQLWVVRGSGSGTDLQTVEVGAQTYRDLYGDWYPHLFIFYTTNNYTHSGDNFGGYNTDVNGWQQTSQRVYPTARLAESAYGGVQYDLALKVTLYNGNWWVRVGDEWMGYYPAALFNSTGLHDQAQVVDWGGEIVDDVTNHPEATSTWMGSGHFPNEGWSRAASMHNLAYQSDSAGTMAGFRGNPSVTNTNAYQITTDFSGTTTWGSFMYWGGPGGVE
ncbi:neprosin family prolyl endopeptidase [Streptomyces cyanogenus]|uniref:Glucoamylase type of glycohydrolase n=1 Tax=Streptomyces cyanogenus TaxID=80860 RepID=A0ABX7TZU7_STRCY|nr:neprosin family prolyl endopeptidase [Streptomyces cyanogenus]QTE02310.1 Putative glucoamylase type of glycohydrolase [Streptomyces cyanogenus]